MTATEVLAKLSGDFGDSLESSMFGIITTPVAGWVASLLGLGGDAGGLAGIDLTNQLNKLQGDVSSIIGDLSSLTGNLEGYISELADNSSIQPAVSAVQAYFQSGAGANGNRVPMTVPITMLLDNDSDAQLLGNVHDVLVGSSADDSQPNVIAYYTTLLQKKLLRYNSDNQYKVPSPRRQAAFDDVFLYYQQLQAVLMQMMVEAAHQGQSASVQANPNDHSGSQPPNYVAAMQAYKRYADQVAEQSSFVPLTTTGVGFNEAGAFWGGTPTLGASALVFDRQNTEPGLPPMGLAWASANIHSFGWLTTVLWVQQQLNAPGAWMMRIPSGDELDTLFKTLQDSSGNAVTSATIADSLQQVGFSISLSGNSTTGGTPFVTKEALESSNWTILNPGSVTVGGGGEHGIPGRVIPTADGYQCTWFYDLMNGVYVTVVVSCPVTGLATFQTVATDAVFTDIANATSITWTSTMGSTTLSELDLRALSGGYADALFIYRLANADPASNVNTDPPVEEPDATSFQISSVVNSDATVSLTASANYQRFDRGAADYRPIRLDVPNVYWCLADADQGNATISQSGVVTWKANQQVTATAVRGPVTALLQVQCPSSFVAPPPPTVSKVNIYPRTVKMYAANLATQPQAVQFNAQILWSDGSTSAFGDGQSSNGQFQFGFAEANQHLILDVEQTSTFTIPAGTPSGTNFQINVTVNGGQLTDLAKITIG